MRTVLFATFAFLLVVPAQALPAPPSALSGAATDVLDAAAQDAFAAAGRPDAKSIPQALAAHAYLSTLGLLAEFTTNREQDTFWEAAQMDPSPPDAFMKSVFDVGQRAHQALQANLTRLEAATTPTVGVATAARLAAAAELLVQGESDLTLAGRFFGGSLRREDVSYPSQRYTILLPAEKALVHATAASVVLDGLTPDAGGARVDTAALLGKVKAHGGAGTGWQLASHGAFHELARHLRLYAGQQPNATLESLETTIGKLDAAFQGPSDPASVVLASARLDGAWWVARGQQEGTNQLWTVTLTFLNGRAASALYEQSLLAESVQAAGPAWGLWALAAGGVAAVFALVALWRRGRRGRAKSTAVLLVVAALACLPAVPVVAHGDDTHTVPGQPAATVVPLPEAPFAYTGSQRAAYGNVAAGPDGILHFAWVGCEGRPAAGCFDVYHRSLDPATGTWGPIQLVADPPTNASMARVAVAGGEVHIAWLQGEGKEAGQPLEFAHCLLRPSKCESATRISTIGQFTSGAKLVPVGDRLFATWSEEETTGLAKVYGRWWKDGGWGLTFTISNPTRVARYPEAAADAAGTVHIVWTGNTVSALSSTRVLDYAAVTVDGVSDGPLTLPATPVDFRSRPVVDVLANGTVGIAYNGVRDVFVMERWPGNRDWNPAVNVSRTQRLSQAWPQLNAHGNDWIVSWVTGTIGQFHLWQAHREGGYWLRPQIMVGAPYDGILFLPQSIVLGDRLHVVWTGNSTGTFDLRMLHEAWPADVTTSTPPEVWDVSPDDDAWVRGPAVRLSALVASAAPVTDDGASWTVDGKPLPTTVDGNGNVHAETELTDGTHKARLSVRDVKGGSTEQALEFQVDSAAPTFTSTVRVGGQERPDAKGWQDAAVTVAATPNEDGGSPVHVQVDYNGLGNWADLNGTLTLPEGYLLTVRLRAIDGAGNVALGAPMELGWDATAPDVALAMPRWTNGAVTPVRVTQGDQGSPVTVTLAVSTAAGASVSTVELPLAGVQIPVLVEGNYRVHVTAKDALGHSQDVGTFDLGVDRQGPTVAVSGGNLRLQDRGASGLANVTFRGEEPRLLDGDATLPRDQAPGSEVELWLRDHAGNLWHGTANLDTGEVQEIVLGVNGAGSTTKKSAEPAVALLAVALLGLCVLRRKAL